jgi:hypothetical protein
VLPPTSQKMRRRRYISITTIDFDGSGKPGGILRYFPSLEVSFVWIDMDLGDGD